jgi:uncharacterized protein YndB with AHSA1/START domain
MLAPPDRIFDLVDDFHNWASWSPFEKYDGAMKKTFSGAVRGKGAVYAWAGNSRAGEGRMEILDTVPPSRIRIKLDFLKPFEGHNTSEFTLDGKGASTAVTWAMSGPQPYRVRGGSRQYEGRRRKKYDRFQVKEQSNANQRLSEF